MRLKYLAIIIMIIIIVATMISIMGLLYKERAVKPTPSQIITNISVGSEIFLPYPRIKGNISLEEALSMRRSIREYKDIPLTLEQLSQLLWAAQGINEVHYGFRTAPSAGATYPLEVYVVVSPNGVKGLPAGIYHYNVHRHSLIVMKLGDFRKALTDAALGQTWVYKAPINVVITAIYERTTIRYGERGIRYVHMEVGHVGQNIYLQAVALGLGTVVIGAFHDNVVQEIIGVPKNEHPLYIIPVGVPQKLYRLNYEDLIKYYERQRSGS